MLSLNFKLRASAAKAARMGAKNKREAERMHRIFLRDLSSTRVTLADSRKAGNCIEGSLVFAERRLGLSRAEILGAAHLFAVPAKRLIAAALGSPDLSRVEAAVKTAWRRETTISI